MCCDDCVNRRRFLAIAAGGAAAALAACGDGELSGVPGVGGAGPVITPPVGGGPTTKVVKVGDIPQLANTGTLVQITGTAVAVKRTGTVDFVAFYMSCTHQSCLTNVVNNAFLCQCHFSEFDNDGKVIVGPATSDLATRSTSYDVATDLLTINL